ncbi:hypothetical protein [Pontibacillus yanchengensis]|uniref:Competence protein ComG n=1 Tax=Pontibacillus yanchengensis Y32 TaxID=1385514 RepID=A0A0A2TUM0_9BACI|nr:hypothetical protein [Pontibacillus yanchengensis]KGP72985.1 hypothetical protein N782_08580 [Pontibacillus yanchengensis Y32]
MRKRLALFQNDSGFALPILLTLITLTFIVLSALLLELQHSQALTINEKEQIQLDTLFQMAHASVLEECREHTFQMDHHYVYDFFYGKVTAIGSLQADQKVRVEYRINTINNSEKGLVQYISMPSE